MTARYVTLGDGRAIALGSYVAAWRTTLAAPADQRFKGRPSDPRGWTGDASREDVLREFRDGLTDRINRHIPGYGVGRKWRWEWQRDVARIAWNLNGRRILTRVRECPKEIRKRLAHRLHDDGDF